MKFMNSAAMKIVMKMLNFLQLLSYMFMINTVYPVHLYYFMKIFVQILFPMAPEWGEESSKENFGLFFGSVEVTPQYLKFERYPQKIKNLGLTTNFVLSCIEGLEQILVFTALFQIVRFLKRRVIYRFRTKAQFNESPWRILYELSYGMIWKSFESNTLQIFVSFFLSLFNFQYRELYYLQSLFVQIIFFLCLGYYFYKAYLAINFTKDSRKRYLVYEKYAPLVGDIVFDQHIQEKDVYLRRTKMEEYLKFSPFFIRNYHLIYGNMRKLMMAFLLVRFSEFPMVLWPLLMTTQIFNILVILVFRPFYFSAINYAKLIAEVLLFTLYLIFYLIELVSFPLREDPFLSLPESSQNLLILYGWVGMGLIVALSAIYLFMQFQVLFFFLLKLKTKMNIQKRNRELGE